MRMVNGPEFDKMDFGMLYSFSDKECGYVDIMLLQWDEKEKEENMLQCPYYYICIADYAPGGENLFGEDTKIAIVSVPISMEEDIAMEIEDLHLREMVKGFIKEHFYALSFYWFKLWNHYDLAEYFKFTKNKMPVTKALCKISEQKQYPHYP